MDGFYLINISARPRFRGMPSVLRVLSFVCVGIGILLRSVNHHGQGEEASRILPQREEPTPEQEALFDMTIPFLAEGTFVGRLEEKL